MGLGCPQPHPQWGRHAAKQHLQHALPACRPARSEEAASTPPFDVELGVRLGEAASQAMWGSAHYCVMMDPIQVKMDHIQQLGERAGGGAVVVVVEVEVEAGRGRWGGGGGQRRGHWAMQQTAGAAGVFVSGVRAMALALLRLSACAGPGHKAPIPSPLHPPNLLPLRPSLQRDCFLTGLVQS